MKFSLEWLKDHLDTQADLQSIISGLTNVGLEVESVYDPNVIFEKFVVAHIDTAEKHPQADRLQVCQVSYGDGKQAQVVCGAPNARAGMFVVLALPSALIPNGQFIIKKSKIRGVESCGMMCSFQELMLDGKSDGIIELGEEMKPLLGASIVNALNLDTIIDVSVTPNRGDCFAVRGIARDLAAAGLGKLKPLKSSVISHQFDFPFEVCVDNEKNVGNYADVIRLQVIKNVKNCQSPDWLKKRLISAGIEPISALVDITNFFCIERARPLHAYDVGCISGNKLNIRLADDKEKITDLKGRDLPLACDIAVIGDDVGALSVLGVIGGDRSKITNDTSVVMLESALLNPNSVAYAGRKLNIISESRTRFERGIDSDYAQQGLIDAVSMVLEICGGQVSSEYVYSAKNFDKKPEVSLSQSKLNAVCGMEIPLTLAKEKLDLLGFDIINYTEQEIKVSPPSWRNDISIEEDLIEEVIRLVGYDKILPQPVPSELSAHMGDETYSIQQKTNGVKRCLCSLGFDEVISYAFLSKEANSIFHKKVTLAVDITNPISEDLSQMRVSMLPNLLEISLKNTNASANSSRIFEVGAIYHSDFTQTLVAGGCDFSSAPEQHWLRNEKRDVFSIKSDVMSIIESYGLPSDRLSTTSDGINPWYHPNRSGRLSFGKHSLAEFGQMHPLVLKKLGFTSDEVFCFEINLDTLFNLSQKNSDGTIQQKKFQSIERDFAFVLDNNVPAGEVITQIKKLYPDLIKDICIFDVYVGDKVENGKKSLALRVRMQPLDATFTEEQIKGFSDNIMNMVQENFGGKIRQ